MAKIKKRVDARFLVRIRNKEEHRVFGRLYFGEMNEEKDKTVEERIYKFVEKMPCGSEITNGIVLIEAGVLNSEKQKAMGLPADILPQFTYWIGLQINDDALWEKLEKRNTHAISIGITEETEI